MKFYSHGQDLATFVKDKLGMLFPQAGNPTVQSANYAFIPGQFDFELDWGSRVPLGNVLQLTRELRIEPLDSGLQRTSTLLRLAQTLPTTSRAPNVPKLSANSDTGLQIQIDSQVVDVLQTAWREFESAPYVPTPLAELLNVFDVYNTTLNDVLEGERFADMRPFVQAVRV